MRNYQMAIVAIVSVLLFASISGAAELKDGFMQYKWGEDISRYQGLTNLHSKGDVSYYSNPGESYAIDDIRIDNVIFGFYKESLFAVYIAIDTMEVYDDIRLHMKSKYGLPDHKTVGDEHLTLKWEYQDIIIKLKTNKFEEKMKLAFYYGPLARELKKSQLDEIDTTSFRFFPIDKNKKPEKFHFLEF